MEKEGRPAGAADSNRGGDAADEGLKVFGHAAEPGGKTVVVERIKCREGWAERLKPCIVMICSCM